jgi:hypothetical protein
MGQSPKIGQRWIFDCDETVKYICEITEVIGDTSKTKVVQLLKNYENYTFVGAQKSTYKINESGYFIYLEGQDKSD